MPQRVTTSGKIPLKQLWRAGVDWRFWIIVVFVAAIGLALVSIVLLGNPFGLPNAGLR